MVRDENFDQKYGSDFYFYFSILCIFSKYSHNKFQLPTPPSPIARAKKSFFIVLNFKYRYPASDILCAALKGLEAYPTDPSTKYTVTNACCVLGPIRYRITIQRISEAELCRDRYVRFSIKKKRIFLSSYRGGWSWVLKLVVRVLGKYTQNIKIKIKTVLVFQNFISYFWSKFSSRTKIFGCFLVFARGK